MGLERVVFLETALWTYLILLLYWAPTPLPPFQPLSNPNSSNPPTLGRREGRLEGEEGVDLFKLLPSD